MGAGLHHVIPETGRVVCRLVPVVAGVMEHQVFDLTGIPETAIAPGIGQQLLQDIAQAALPPAWSVPEPAMAFAFPALRFSAWVPK